jgi:hypothetical protein
MSSQTLGGTIKWWDCRNKLQQLPCDCLLIDKTVEAQRYTISGTYFRLLMAEKTISE